MEIEVTELKNRILDVIAAVLTCAWCVAQFHGAVLGSCEWINKAAPTAGPAKSEWALAKMKMNFVPQRPGAEPHKSPGLYSVPASALAS